MNTSVDDELMTIAKAIKSFKKQTRDWTYVVTQDNGVNRRIVHSKLGSFYRYEVVTWPGKLHIGGEIPGPDSEYTFTRLADMFEFFRPRGEITPSKVNLHYWSEKLSNRGRPDAKEYTKAALDRQVREHVSDLREGFYDRETAEAMVAKVWELYRNHHSMGALYEREGAAEFLRDLEYAEVASDTWEWDLTDYKPSFVYSCVAIVFAIQEWDRRVSEAGPLARRMRDPRGVLHLPGKKAHTMERKVWI